MITEQDLREAIAECQGTRNPNASTCIKLAAYYTILNNLTDKHEELPPLSYSFAEGPEIPYGKSDFSQITMTKGIEKVFPILDEMMDALSVLNPKLYDGVLRKISDL